MATKRLPRPRDPIQLAKLIGDIATGQVKDEVPGNPSLEFARKGGLKGGIVRAAKLAPERRTEIAKKAAQARWIKKASK
ncbi:MAG TPA: RNA-binding protein [Pseudolabrys sp.]